VTDDPRYPIGQFVPPEETSAASRRASIAVLAEFPARLAAALEGLEDAQLDTPYRDGGWTVRQLAHHVADSHSNAVMRFRLALTEELPTIRVYDQERWADLPDALTEPVASSLRLLTGLHSRWVALLEALGPDDWERELNHPEFPGPLRLWWMLAMYDWHARHHLAHVTRLRARQGW
jgi:hypothetical protein